MLVAVNYAGRASDARRSCRKFKPPAVAYCDPADVAVAVEATVLFKQTKTRLGAIDVIINDAGTTQRRFRPVADTDDALFDRLFAINVMGIFNTMCAAAKRLRPGCAS